MSRIRLSKKAANRTKQKELLLLSLKALQYGGHLRKGVLLAKRYENAYLNDSEMMVFWLKLYLAAGDLDAASALSKKLLKQRGGK
jgi:hypothetical protein